MVQYSRYTGQQYHSVIKTDSDVMLIIKTDSDVMLTILLALPLQKQMVVHVASAIKRNETISDFLKE